MDNIQFSTGEKLPVFFPFQAMVELMGDDGILSYLNKYTSMKHQIDILRVGLKYGAIENGKSFEMTDKEVGELAQKNLRQLKEVFGMYDSELAIYLKVYFSTEEEDDDKPKKKLTKEEKEKNEKAVKP